MSIEPIGRIASAGGSRASHWNWLDLLRSKYQGGTGKAAHTSGDISPEELQHAVDELNQVARAFAKHAEFRIHEASGQVMVRIVDDHNGEIIREIPPERALDLAAEIQELLGLVLDKKA